MKVETIEVSCFSSGFSDLEEYVSFSFFLFFSFSPLLLYIVLVNCLLLFALCSDILNLYHYMTPHLFFTR